ncbi:unnamed protein product [Dicrocoelium dendriticum]|nr:unnamed protein product [Dicrocoelium dendriticum]
MNINSFFLNVQLLYFVTFSTTLVFNVTVGLVVGAICCLLALAEGQRTFRVTPLHNVPGTELFLPDTPGEVPSAKATWNGASTNHIPYEIIACQLVGSLNFASAEQLRARMKSFLEKNTHHANDSTSLENKPLTTSLDEKGEDNPLSKTNNTSNSKSDKACQSARKRYILLDVNGLSDVDPFGAQYLTDLHRELSGSGFAVVYVGEIHRHKCLDTSSWLRVPLISLSYPSLYDAYVACHNHLRLASTWMNSSEDLSKL